jgi:hypothetical protein
MANKATKPAKKAEELEVRDAPEEEEETEDEAEARPAPVRPASAEERRARMRARRAAAPAIVPEAPEADHGHGHDHGHQDEEEDEIDTSNDPTWWVPHAVLGAIVLLGIFGFFGAFNKLAEKIGYKGIPGLVAATESTSKPVENKPAEQAQRPAPPMQQPMPQQQGEMFGAKHLLVMYKGSMRAPDNISRSKDEAKARAEEARKKAKAGTKFEDLVKEYSDEPGAGQRGGDLGKFPKGRMVGPFQDAVEKTKVGEVSDLVETPFGYHVILRTQ